MNENRTIHLADVPIGGKNGFLWNRLHSEREQICEALIKDSEERLQARLRKLDDALDRLMSGSYGICSKCGRAIEESKLDIDPVLALCRDCGEPGTAASSEYNSDDLLLDSLNPFDTVLLRTHNSDYRILMLDPQNGRALVEGGDYLREPNEALVIGSAIPGSDFKSGSICVGCCLEMWVNERVFLTSPIKSVHVRRNSIAESAQEISAALH
jgi:DksA/TraR C4-type zinc finger protein